MAKVELHMVKAVPALGDEYRNPAFGKMSVGCTPKVVDEDVADDICRRFPGSFETKPLGSTKPEPRLVSQSMTEHPQLSTRDRVVELGDKDPDDRKPRPGSKPKPDVETVIGAGKYAKNKGKR